MSSIGRGFTRNYLFMLIGAVCLTAAVVYFLVDPAVRLGQSRDDRRLVEVNAILNSILRKQLDGKTAFSGEGTARILADDRYAQIIVTDDTAIDCADATQRPGCDQKMIAAAGTGCVVNVGSGGFGQLVPTYVGEIPVDPRGSGKESACSSASDCAFKGDLFYGSRNSGYYLHKYTSGRLEIGACKPDLAASISVSAGLRQ